MNDRRTFLKRLAAAGAAAGAASLIPGAGGAFGQDRVNKVNVRGGAIDVHHHFLPPGQTVNRAWSPQMSLDQMDKFGISVAILSMTQNGELLYNGTEKGRTEIRRGNDYGAELVQKYPKKFGQMAGVPLPDLEGSLREIEYAYDTLKVDAVGIYSNDNRGRWPGDPYFEPMWQELNRRNAIVYMHPLAPPCCSNLKYGPASSMVEFDFDVTRGRQHRRQRRDVPLPEHSLHHRALGRDRADAGGSHEGPRAEGRRAVHAERALRRAPQVVFRHRARELPVADGGGARVHAGVADSVRYRLLTGADRVHGQRAAGPDAAEGLRAEGVAHERRAAVPEIQTDSLVIARP